MTAQEFSMIEWDDIESVSTNDGKVHEGEFFLSKHGYVLCDKADGSQIKISVSSIVYASHK